MDIPFAIHLHEDWIKVCGSVMIGAINVTKMLQVRTAEHAYNMTCLSTLHEHYDKAEQAVSATGKSIHGYYIVNLNVCMHHAELASIKALGA